MPGKSARGGAVWALRLRPPQLPTRLRAPLSQASRLRAPLSHTLLWRAVCLPQPTTMAVAVVRWRCPSTVLRALLSHAPLSHTLRWGGVGRGRAGHGIKKALHHESTTERGCWNNRYEPRTPFWSFYMERWFILRSRTGSTRSGECVVHLNRIARPALHGLASVAFI